MVYLFIFRTDDQICFTRREAEAPDGAHCGSLFCRQRPMQGLPAGSAFPGSFQVGCTAEKSPQVRFYHAFCLRLVGKQRGPLPGRVGPQQWILSPAESESVLMHADEQVQRSAWMLSSCGGKGCASSASFSAGTGKAEKSVYTQHFAAYTLIL